MSSNITPLYALLKRELSLNTRQGGGIGLALIFFLSLVILFPFGIGPNMTTLSLFAPAILWTGVLLSIMLGLEKLFQPDEEDGIRDYYASRGLGDVYKRQGINYQNVEGVLDALHVEEVHGTKIVKL